MPRGTAAPQPHRFTVDDLERMVDVGLLHPRQRVELVDGELVDVSPQQPEHITLKDELRDRLVAAYGSDVHVRDQAPLALGPGDLPEPDLAVVRGARRDYLHCHPTGRDVVLVVEVSQTTAAHDRRKAVRYAKGGVPEYWQLDIEARRLIVQRGPVAEGYPETASLFEDDEITPPGTQARLRVGDLLP